MSELAIERRRLGAWSALLLFIVVFVGIYAAMKWAQSLVAPHLHLSGPRDIAAFRAAGSVVLLWIEFAAMVLVLRMRGQTLADIGWRRRSPFAGWLVAAATVVLYVGFSAMGPMLKGAPVFSDWSLFRVATALGIGITAGVCEEAIFRGFVMTQARDGGAPAFVQVLLSAALFGLAHAGWGSMSGSLQWASMIGAIAATSILGGLLAAIFLVARRSLMPAVAAHGLIDLAIEPWLLLFAIQGFRGA